MTMYRPGRAKSELAASCEPGFWNRRADGVVTLCHGYDIRQRTLNKKPKRARGQMAYCREHIAERELLYRRSGALLRADVNGKTALFETDRQTACLSA
jgi:hypothetical protein